MGGISVAALTSMPVSWLLWQRPPSIPVLTVVCRATFLLRPGEAALAPEHEPLAIADQPYPDGASCGLYAPADLVPLKPRADVVLVGSAFAPGGQKVRSLYTRLVVGEVDKRIEVFADRHFDQQGTLREGPRFTSMPLVYERAAGGPDTPNPIGLRPGARDTYGHLALPNLQPPGLEIATPSDPIAPIGFGPIAGGWATRAALLGRSAGGRRPDAWNGQLLPADLDPGYFNVAPRDQQIQALREDERIVLENLHPQHPELVTRLPGSRPRVFVEGTAATPQALAMRADTLWIDTGRALVTMTWRGQLVLEHAQQSVCVLAALEQPGQPLGWADLDRLRKVMARFGRSLEKVDATQAAAMGSASSKPWVPTQTITVSSPAALSQTLPFVHSAQQAPPTSHAEGGLPFRAPGAAAPLQPAPPQQALVAAGPSVDRITAPVLHAPPPVVARPVVAAAAAAPSPARAGAIDALCLVGFDPEILPRLRRDARFAPLLDALEEQALDPELDHAELGEPAADMEERREIFEILARGAAVGEDDLVAGLAAAARDDGRLLHPIALVTGELRFAFDELDALKATASAAAPHAGTDVEARRILELARAFLATPGLPAAAAVAEGLTTRVRETFEKRGLVSAGYLDAQAERALLGGRLFLRRGIFGAPHLRALFHTGSDRPPIPAYLTEALAAGLPAVQRLWARMLVHVHPAADQYEVHAVALRAAALAIVIKPMPRR